MEYIFLNLTTLNIQIFSFPAEDRSYRVTTESSPGIYLHGSALPSVCGLTAQPL